MALTLERLQHVVREPLQRIGLSATQKPIDDVARFLVGTKNIGPEGRPDCAIVDEGHRRAMELAIELPGRPLRRSCRARRGSRSTTGSRHSSVSTGPRSSSRTPVAGGAGDATSERTDWRGLGHGAPREPGEGGAARRGGAPQGWKVARAVATASLELGIDIGTVDLVCQLGSTRRISTFLQRVGRSGHTIRGAPKGRLFRSTRDELVECGAAARR